MVFDSYWLNANGPLQDEPNETNPNFPYQPGPAPSPAPAPVPPATEPVAEPVVDPAGGGGGGGVSFAPSGIPGMAYRAVPRFTAPQFEAPDAAAVLASPGYQFRLGQGQQGIERSAAARGLLRTGGTLRDISEYNQNFASAEYQNEFNRALQSFGTKYQGAKDEFAPLLAQWQTFSQADLARALAAYSRDTAWYNPNAGGGGGAAPIIIGDPPIPPGQR